MPIGKKAQAFDGRGLVTTGRARCAKFNNEVWLSLVERYVRDVEVASSNLVTSTKIGFESNLKALFLCLQHRKF